MENLELNNLTIRELIELNKKITEIISKKKKGKKSNSDKSKIVIASISAEEKAKRIDKINTKNKGVFLDKFVEYKPKQ